MNHRPRDRAREQAAITAAADRLLTGAPLRSVSGKLTQTELIRESGLRRDVVYEHRDIIDAFKAEVKAQHHVPTAVQAVTDQRDNLTGQITDIKAQLARERETNATLRRLAVELSIELDQAREELAGATTVTRLSSHRRHTGPHS